MGWSLLPNALRHFKIYCASPSITSQLVLFLWRTVEIDPLGHMRVVEALQNFVQKYGIISSQKSGNFVNPRYWLGAELYGKSFLGINMEKE